MNLESLIPSLETAQSLSFGTLIGAGAGLLTHSVGAFPAGTDTMIVGFGGGLVGAGLHKGIDALVVRALLRPVGCAVAFYAGLVEVVLLGAFLPTGEWKQIVHERIRARLRGRNAFKELPSPPSTKPRTRRRKSARTESAPAASAVAAEQPESEFIGKRGG
jgi:hypothetical protein